MNGYDFSFDRMTGENREYLLNQHYNQGEIGEIYVNFKVRSVQTVTLTIFFKLDELLVNLRSFITVSLKAAKYEIQNPQLVAQHCFVASFGRCFPFFTWRDQLVAQQMKKCGALMA